MKFIFKDTKTTLKTLAYYQIIGGILGIIMTAWALLKIETLNGIILFIFLLALFLFSVYKKII